MADATGNKFTLAAVVAWRTPGASGHIIQAAGAPSLWTETISTPAQLAGRRCRQRVLRRARAEVREEPSQIDSRRRLYGSTAGRRLLDVHSPKLIICGDHAPSARDTRRRSSGRDIRAKPVLLLL